MGNRHEPEKIQVGLRHAKGSQARLEEKQKLKPVALYFCVYQNGKHQSHNYTVMAVGRRHGLTCRWYMSRVTACTEGVWYCHGL